MLHLRSFTFNPFQENTYIVYDDNNNCWIIDPGMYGESEVRELYNFIDQSGLNPQSIINTHAHIDHILGVNAVVEKYKIPFRLHQSEQSVLKNAAGSALMFGFQLDKVPVPDSFIEGDQILNLGEENLKVLFVPGHSPGSIAFYYPRGNWVVAGDALFAGSIGRTDLPGGSHPTLLSSIQQQLMTLPPDTIVFPGHGPETTIGTEKAQNPFLTEL